MPTSKENDELAGCLILLAILLLGYVLCVWPDLAIWVRVLIILSTVLVLGVIIAAIVANAVEELKEAEWQRKNPWVKGRSKGERRLIFLVGQIYGDASIEPSYRPAWLVGPGGGRMHVDVGVPSHKMAFEYQGEQHERPVQHWGGEWALGDQQQRDTWKRELLEEHGWQLIQVWYDESLTLASLNRKIEDAVNHYAGHA